MALHVEHVQAVDRADRRRQPGTLHIRQRIRCTDQTRTVVAS
jgi:hypothetical protein